MNIICHLKTKCHPLSIQFTDVCTIKYTHMCYIRFSNQYFSKHTCMIMENWNENFCKIKKGKCDADALMFNII